MVFYQRFDAVETFPGMATVNTADLFPIVQTTHAAYIIEVFAGTGLFPKVGEVQTVPSSTPSVNNKMSVLVSPFADAVEISKDMFDKLIISFKSILLSNIHLSFRTAV